MMADTYKQRPSDIIGIDNNYAAYCFDEACMYIKITIDKNIMDSRNGKPTKRLNFANGDDSIKSKIKHYKSLEDMYKQYGI